MPLSFIIFYLLTFNTGHAAVRDAANTHFVTYFDVCHILSHLNTIDLILILSPIRQLQE
jgi:hypothetical protein